MRYCIKCRPSDISILVDGAPSDISILVDGAPSNYIKPIDLSIIYKTCKECNIVKHINT